MGTSNAPIMCSADDIVDAFQRITSQERTALSKSLNGVMLRGALAVPVGTPGTSNRPATSAGAIVGFSLRNSAAASIAVQIYAGPDANSTLLFDVTLAQGESVRDWFGPAGIGYDDTGLFVTASGTYDGCVFLRAVEL